MTKQSRLTALERYVGINDTSEQEHDFMQVIRGPQQGEQDNHIEFFIDGELVDQSEYDRIWSMQPKDIPMEIFVHLSG